MTIIEVEFASPLWDLCVSLRSKVLREPLGLEFSAKDLALEYKQKSYALISANHDLCACLMYVNLGSDLWKMRQVCVSPQSQGKGLGRILSYESEKQIQDDYNAKEIVLNAREGVVPFYEKLGYSKVGDIFVEVGIPHQKMCKKLININPNS